MIVTVEDGFDPALVRQRLAACGLWATPLEGGLAPQLCIEPHSAAVARDALLAIEGVAAVSAEPSAHPLVDRHPASVIVAGAEIGGPRPVVVAGPCSVESAEQVHGIAATLRAMGVTLLRGGAFKPRTSPYSFQGRGERALLWLRDAADAHGMGVVTEAMGAEDVARVAEVADLVQIGSRNMHDYALLRTVGRAGKPVLLKRGMAATVEEWLCAAEHCLLSGAQSVVFCERGIRGFDPSTRNVLDLGAVALLAHVLRLPVIVDPSHAAGRRDLVPALARAAIAAGAAGLMIETHADPGSALSDGPQALLPSSLETLLRSVGAPS